MPQAFRGSKLKYDLVVNDKDSLGLGKAGQYDKKKKIIYIYIRCDMHHDIQV